MYLMPFCKNTDRLWQVSRKGFITSLQRLSHQYETGVPGWRRALQMSLPLTC